MIWRGGIFVVPESGIQNPESRIQNPESSFGFWVLGSDLGFDFSVLGSGSVELWVLGWVCGDFFLLFPDQNGK